MMTSIGAVLDRVHAIVVAQGFGLATLPFSFDLQPSTHLDATYHLRSRRVGTDPMLNGYQTERHQVSVFLARRTKRNPAGALRQLATDLALLEQAILTDSDSGIYDFYAEDGSASTEPSPAAKTGEDFVVAQFQIILAFDTEP